MSNEELATRIRAGEPELLPELWAQVEKFVTWRAMLLIDTAKTAATPLPCELGDLVNGGYFALVAAVDSYDQSKGAFLTWLGQHLKTSFAETAGFRTAAARYDALRASRSLSDPLGSDPDDGNTLQDIVPDPAAAAAMEGVEDQIYRAELAAALEAAVAELPEEQAEIIRRRYYERQTFRELEEDMGLRPGSAHGKERDALHKIRRSPAGNRLRGFLDFDYYGGTGIFSYLHSGLSIQERYLMAQERAEAAAKKRERAE